MMVGNTLEVGPQPGDAAAYRALSALAHALYETDHVAIVRYCRTQGPRMCMKERERPARAGERAFISLSVCVREACVFDPRMHVCTD
jgi:hypothetical protein